MKKTVNARDVKRKGKRMIESTRNLKRKEKVVKNLPQRRKGNKNKRKQRTEKKAVKRNLQMTKGNTKARKLRTETDSSDDERKQRKDKKAVKRNLHMMKGEVIKAKEKTRKKVVKSLQMTKGKTKKRTDERIHPLQKRRTCRKVMMHMCLRMKGKILTMKKSKTDHKKSKKDK